MRRLLAALLALPLVACDAIPTLVFDGGAQPDATTEDGPSEASGDSGGDSGDSGEPPEAGCPNELPDGATLCCGRIACFGVGCPVACPGCLQTCTPAEVCCPTPSGKAFCKPSC